MAAKVVGAIREHDWNRNTDLIELRKKGYTPWSHLHDNQFVPRPMRISTRSESRRALSALSLVLAANSDYNPDSDYMFEVMLPVEEVARRMGVLHVYDNGRKSYDPTLHAMRVLEEMGYVIVHRTKDSDSGQFKPMRLFLSDKFFTSRGMSLSEVRESLYKFRQWAIGVGVAESLKEKYQRHLLKMARLGIDIERHHSLKNRLRQIKRWVVSPELRAEKNVVEEDLGAILDEQQEKLRQMASKPNTSRYRQAWVRWSTSQEAPPAVTYRLEKALKAEFPELYFTDPEKYYQLLLDRAGVPINFN